MAQVLQLKRGLEANLTNANLREGEIALTLDSKKLVFGGSTAGEIVHLTDIHYGATEPAASERHKLWVADVNGKTYIRKFNAVSGAYEDISGAEIIDDVNVSGDTVFSSQKVQDLLSLYYTQVELDEFFANIEAKQAEQDSKLAQLQTDLTAEVSRASSKEAELDGKIADEVTRAKGEESRIEGKVDSLQAAFDQHETDNQTSLNTKVDKSTLAQPNGVATLDEEGKLLVSQLPDLAKEVRIAETFADMTAIPSPFVGLYVFVKAPQDGDATVQSGGATYIYDGSTFTKVSEAESLDVVARYGNLVDVTHTVDEANDTVDYVQAKKAELDDAIAKKHSHANAAILDQLVAQGNAGMFVKINAAGDGLEFTNEVDCGTF